MSDEHSKTLTILLPALNEEESIGEVIDSIPMQEVAGAGYETSILVLDGHSTDRTRSIAQERGAKVVIQKGRGKGLAVRMGFEMSDSDFLIMMDADGTYPTEDVPTFLATLDKGADVVMGSRFLGGIEKGSMSNLNRAGNRLLSLLASTLYRRETTDVCTGMWGFNRKTLKTLRLDSTTFEIESEIFAQASKAGLGIREIPIRYSRRKGRAKLRSLRSGTRIGLKLVRKRIVP